MKETDFNLALAGRWSNMATSVLLTQSFELLQRRAYLPKRFTDSERQLERTRIDLVDACLVRNIGNEGVYFN